MFRINRLPYQTQIFITLTILIQIALPPGFRSASGQANNPIFVDSGQLLGTTGGEHVEVGDLDNDGDLDAFIFGGVDGKSRVWINQGGVQGGKRGKYLDSGQVLKTSFPSWGIIGDIDGDGDLDAVTVCDNNSPFWINQGGMQGGTLGVYAQGDQSLGNFCGKAMVLGDVDSDGDLDIFVVSQSVPATASGHNRLWINQGSVQGGIPGTFLDSGQDLGISASSAAAMGDLDNDNDLDILVAADDKQSALVLLNQGGTQRGALGHFLDNGQKSGNIPGLIILIDVDNDGDLDAVASGSLWLNQGGLQRGTLGNFVNSGQGLGNGGARSIAVGDLDGDKDIDLIIIDGGPSFNRILLNQGGEQGGVLGTFTASEQLVCGLSCTSIALGDLDGDNDLDIISVGGPHPVPAKIFFNQIGNGFAASDASLTQADFTKDGVFGDLDNDGDLDVIVVSSGESKIWLNQGGIQNGTLGTFVLSNQVIGEPNYSGTGTVVGDLDGDNDLDVVEGVAAKGNQIWFNQGGNQGGVVGIFVNSGQNLGVSRWPTALGDVDGDDDLDVIVLEEKFSKVWLNQGGVQEGIPGNFLDSGQLLIDPSGETWTALALGDLDNDGDLDALINATIWRNQGGQQGGVQGTFMAQGNIFSGSTFDIKFGLGAVLGDFDGDGDLDLFVATIPANFLLINQGQAQQGAPGTFKIGEQYSSLTRYYYLAAGDIDGDADLDVFAASKGSPHVIFLNQGGAQLGIPGRFIPQTLNPAIKGEFFAVLSDLDNDGDLDAFTDTDSCCDGASTGLLRVFFNKRNQSNRLHVTVKSPSPTHTAPIFSTPVVLTDTVISIPFTLYDPKAQTIGRVIGYFSLDGGGQWHEAIADNDLTNLTAGPEGIEHHYEWNLFRSGVFGQSDNVLFRVVVYAQPLPVAQSGSYSYTNSVPNLYPYPQVTATSVPFRIRGTQVRVLRENENGNMVGASGSTVYHLPKNTIKDAKPLNDPLITNNLGYLPGAGAIHVGDQLIATWPITSTDKYTLFQTSPIFTLSAFTPFTVTQAGVQNLVVSPQHPLFLFNLDLSIEWDARNDTQFMDDLKTNLQEVSRLLYDVTNGQVALGAITIYHNKEHWQEADIRIYATDRLHPSANIGGVTPGLRFETVTKSTTITQSTGITQTLLFAKGYVRMGATWNKFGETGENSAYDWTRTLAHELGHYLFFLLDNYIGLDDHQHVVNVRGCPGFMSNPYNEADSEFHPSFGWEQCMRTLSQSIWGRADWETMHYFYPEVITPTVPINDPAESGPALLPLAVTRFQEVRTNDAISPLQDVTFFLLDEAGQTYFASNQARAYLLRNSDNQLIDLGTPRNDRIRGWGAHPGDTICIYDLAKQPDPMTKCDVVNTLSPYLQLAPQPGWQPNILITPISAFTLSVQVGNVTPGLTLQARLYSAGGVSQTVSSEIVSLNDADNDGVYTGIISSSQVALEAYLYVYNAQNKNQGVVIDYTLGGAPTLSLSGGGTLSLSGGGVIQLRDGTVQQMPAGSTLSISAGSILFLSRKGLTLSLSGGSTLSLSSGGTPIAIDSGGTLSLSGGGVLAFPDGETLSLSSGGTLSLSGGGTLSLSGGGTLSLSGGSAPIRSSDGQVTLFTDNLNFDWDEYYIVQAASVIPAPPLWATVVGNAYRIIPSATLAEPLTADISYQFLGRDVDEKYESNLRIYYYNGDAWQPLRTDVDREHNVAVAQTIGAGVYALMYSIGQNLKGGALNPLLYPLKESRPLTPTLSSIEGKYTTVYGYDAFKPALERWELFDVNLPAYVNLLTELRSGPGYWIWVTEDVELLLKDDAPVQAAATPPVPVLPAIYYGVITDTVDANIPADLTVQAFIGNTECGVGKTKTVDNQIVYVVYVYADDSNATPGCGASGRQVRFKIGEQQATTEVQWQNERFEELPLTFSAKQELPQPLPSRVYLPLVRQ